MAFLAAWLLLHLAIAILRYPELITGAQLDSDGYMRLLRVQALVAGGGWFDPVIEGSNWPHGEVIHWTRPLDVIIVLLAFPLVPFLGWPGAIAVAGTLVSPLVHAAICLSAAWASAPVVAREYRPLVLPVMLSMAGVLAYATMGRADHHALLLLLTLLAIGGWIRAMEGEAADRHAAWVGVTMALALWVSPEALIPLAALFLSGAIVWVAHRDPADSAGLRMTRWLSGGLAVALLLERPPAGWFTVEFDRLSMAHLTMALLGVVFWILAGRLVRSGHLDTWGRRATAAIAGGGATVVALLVIHPGFHRGPAAEADPVMDTIFFPYVNELRSVLPVDWSTAGEFVIYMGAPITALAFLVGLLWRDRGTPMRPAWIVLLSSLALFIPLGSAQVRLVGYAGLVGGLGIAVVLSHALPAISERAEGWNRRVARLGTMLGLTVGFLLLGGALSLLGTDPAEAEARAVETGHCSIRAVAPYFAEARAAGQDGAVALSINHGPELLYRSGAPILSGPYHRNHEGMLALNDLLTGPEPSDAEGIARERGVQWILLCPEADGGYFGRGPESSLYHRLTGGDTPEWLEPIPIDRPGTEGFLLFGVRSEEVR